MSGVAGGRVFTRDQVMEVACRAVDDIASELGSASDLANLVINVISVYLEDPKQSVRGAIVACWGVPDGRVDPEAARAAQDAGRDTVDSVLDWSR